MVVVRGGRLWVSKSSNSASELYGNVEESGGVHGGGK